MTRNVSAFRVAALVALAVAGFVVAGIGYYRATIRTDPVALLVKASTARDIVPRLSGGFRWASLHKAARGLEAANTDPMTLKMAAGAVLQTARADPSPRNSHAAAIAQALTGKPRVAAESLQTLTASAPASAAVWNDLAVAHYLVATGDDDPSRLAQALVAIDAALRVDGAFAEARFNRALILEALGLRDEARDAWDAFLQLDGSSEWSDEARERVARLQPVPPFRTVFERSHERWMSDTVEARAMVHEYPQETRLWGETEVLARWAAAERAGDGAAGAKHLGLARTWGKELAGMRGDGMLDALVAAIDRANPAQRQVLMAAHLAFRDGQAAYKKDLLGDAQRLLETAAGKFQEGGSPGALLATYFAANTIFDQGREKDAEGRLLRLAASAPPGFPAHRAQVLWQLGTVYLAASRWGECIDAYNESIATFEQLGEMNYAATVRENMVEAYDRIGNPALAWKHRMLTLRELGRRRDARLQLAVSSAGRAALMAEDWPVALSLLNVEIAIVRHVDDPLLHADALLRRATVYVHLQDRPSATADLAQARLKIAGLNDASLRAHMEAIAQSVEASVTRDPATAVALLTRAIEYHGSSGRRLYLPELLFDRARFLRAMGEEMRAADDLERAVAQLEADRQSLSAGEDRWGFFHSSGRLFAEAIDLALARNDVQAAFEYAERARARALLESLGASWPLVEAQDLPADTAVVEYAADERRLVIFVLDERGVRAIAHPVPRETLAAEMRAFSAAAERGDENALRKHGRALYQHLIEPVAEELGTKQRLAIVPDLSLDPIPFGALVDAGGRYLVESRTLTMQLSAAVFVRLTKKQRRAEHLLLVKGAEDLGMLAASEREARTIANLYPRTDQLEGDAATPEAFARAAAGADVIHFVGHAVASVGNGRPGYLLLAHGEGPGTFDARQIAALRLERTSLVVLAACSTAAGEKRGTEGTISIARAFLAAGVPSAVGTLWPIEDEEAAALFPVFHRYMARGLTPAEALRATQLDWIRRSQASVALWTALQTIGD